jgi:hypothetical protein
MARVRNKSSVLMPRPAVNSAAALCTAIAAFKKANKENEPPVTDSRRKTYLTTHMRRCQHENAYTAHPNGTVTNGGRVIKGYLSTGGYMRLSSGRYTHRFIAEQLIPNPKGKPYVNHKNGIKTDNRRANLEWCTSSENARHYVDVLKPARVKKPHTCPHCECPECDAAKTLYALHG